MAEGSSGGFSGDFADLKNLPELPEGVSLNEYRSWQNQIVSAIAENQFEVGLSLMEYSDGFFDVFVDESKIATKSGDINIITGTGGKANLIKDGTTATAGSYSANLSRTENYGVIINPNTDLYGLKVETTSEGSNFSKVYLINSSGTILEEKNAGNGETVEFSSSLSSNTDYYVGVDNDDNSYTEALIDTNNSPYTSTDVDITEGGQYDGSVGTGLTPRNIQSVTAVIVGTSGSFTSVSYNLGYSATELTLTADYTLNGQNISAELRTESGSTITTISESEIGDTISISTTATDYDIVWNLSGDGSNTPILNQFEIGLDDGS